MRGVCFRRVYASVAGRRALFPPGFGEPACVATVDCPGRTIFVADAHRDDGKRFVVRAEENLSIAKALPKERQPRHGAIALRLPTGYSA